MRRGSARGRDVAAVVKAVAPRPVNVLVSAPVFTVRELEDLGVRRISVGGALARVAFGAFMRAAREMAGQGTFGALGEAVPLAKLDALFRAEPLELNERRRRTLVPTGR